VNHSTQSTARERRKMRLQSFRKALGELDSAAREAFSR